MTGQRFLHKTLGIPHQLQVGVDKGVPTSGHTYIFIHGLARTHRIWNYMLSHAPDGARVITVDLLGFGDSPKPDWSRYDAAAQAMSLRATIRRLHVRGKVTLVGHSLGSLVAVEYAKRYPNRVDSLVLCSTPIYRSEPAQLARKLPVPASDDIYKKLLRTARTRQELMKKVDLYGRKVKFLQPDFIVDDTNILGVTRSMEMAIENQSVYEWLLTTTIPTELVYGRFDPYVIHKYYRTIARANPYVGIHAVLAGHELSRNKAYSVALLAILFPIPRAEAEHPVVKKARKKQQRATKRQTHAA